MIGIVEESPEHRTAIWTLSRAAFGGDYEAKLIEDLRRDGVVVASLVALEDGEVVGHILFSDLSIEIDGRPISAASLATMAVRPDHQRQGIGSRLVREGLSVVRQRKRSAVIVVGHAGYYPRFGFSAELARKLESPFQGDTFMALELVPNVLAGRAGSVRYPAAFGAG